LILLRELESHRFKLAITFKIGFKVLEQDHFLADSWRVIEEIVLIYLFHGGTLSFFISHTIDVNEVEEIR